MNDCRALLLDLDGTLIGPDETVSPAVAGAVERVSARIPVSIATGREPTQVVEFARELGLTAPQVSDNGALILDPATGNDLWSAPLGRDLARRAMRPIIETDCEFIATHPAGTITDLGDIDTWEITRISALDLNEVAAEKMVSQFPDGDGIEAVKVWLPYNNLWAVDFTREGVNKGTGMRALCKLMAINPSETIAVGDSYNDIPLLRAAGLGIAMGGSPDEVRDAADYTTGPVSEDGLAEAIERFVLPRLS